VLISHFTRACYIPHLSNPPLLCSSFSAINISFWINSCVGLCDTSTVVCDSGNYSIDLIFSNKLTTGEKKSDIHFCLWQRNSLTPPPPTRPPFTPPDIHAQLSAVQFQPVEVLEAFRPLCQHFKTTHLHARCFIKNKSLCEL
jgi:hypothetical protein